MVSTACIVLSPGTELFCPRHFRRNCSLRKLSASVGAPGPHDFAVRAQRRSSSDTACVHRIPPRVRDDAYTPLVEAGRRGEYTISDFQKGKYFRGGTGQPQSA